MDYLQQAKITIDKVRIRVEEHGCKTDEWLQLAIAQTLIAIAERPAQELRPVEFFLLGRNVEEKHAHLGRFHRWHVDCEKKICAVIENENGKIRLLHKDQIRFLDRVPQNDLETVTRPQSTASTSDFMAKMGRIKARNANANTP